MGGGGRKGGGVICGEKPPPPPWPPGLMGTGEGNPPGWPRDDTGVPGSEPGGNMPWWLGMGIMLLSWFMNLPDVSSAIRLAVEFP